MEALVKAGSQIHKQWGIDCKAKYFTLAVTRLLQLKVIDHPVDILHPDIWDQCTKALAEETMFSGSGKHLKSWGKVVEALQKALQEQETWTAARNCLKVSPQSGVGAATQTVTETFKENCLSIKECDLKVIDCVQAVDKVDSAERRDSEEQKLHPKASSPELPAEGKRQAKLFWDGLAEEARNAAKISAAELLLEKAEEGPPPYAAKDCTDPWERTGM
ncbi:hypothetical protein DUI87_03559 [Hirundo rustica rustica]|uniref:Retroviral Gag polyprotein M domain-containing protein n=1 Tax=Hirundo rustica rustica TaxID=333673 RepID=A0A3M0L7E5_HIRRU|nr:hypothetical protein DUI87_03559 [Hirundo rustica rustica]